jgi:3-oxoacyl-[acyl-carrier-protein] synthase II
MKQYRRVVVTGMGAVSPMGLDVPSLWDGIVASKSGIGPITLFDSEGFETRIAGEVKGFDPTNYMDRKEARRTDRFVHLALAATQEALRSSGLQITDKNRDEIGVFVGSGIGGIETSTTQSNVLHTRGPGRVSPFTIPAMIPNIAAGHVSIMSGARGPCMCIITACASSAHSIGEASENIRRGAAQAIIAGGAEASITPLSVAGFNSARAISTRNDDPEGASRPFDATRDGFILSEGAAMLILEDLDHAMKRDAPILAEVVSYAASSDAFHVTQPPEHGEGAALAMKKTLQYGQLAPSEVSYINTHGTSTPIGDVAETRAIKHVFGEYAQRVPVSSSKSQLGHMLGTAGAIESIVCILAIQNNLMPPTINLTHPDPACDLNHIKEKPQPGSVDVVMNNSFGFGGHNVSMILRRFEEA